MFVFIPTSRQVEFGAAAGTNQCGQLLSSTGFTSWPSSWDHRGASTCSEEGGRAERGVSIVECDTPCPITRNNITSFNLYNTRIDPSGCYQAAIAAQLGTASGAVWIHPAILPGDKEIQGRLFFQPRPWVVLFPRQLGGCVTGCFLAMTKYTMVSMRYNLNTVE